MGSDAEPAKLLLPYLQRADELQKHDPLVAYYCRMYAMERGLKVPQKKRTKTTSALLVSLMKQLEKDKKSMKLGPEDNLHVEGFASNVFAKADKQDRAGRADLTTAKTFYAASIFFEILNQFGELQLDIEQKHKYAIWKAADIRKALKEGRTPEPGPPGGDEDLSVHSSSLTSTYDMGPSDSFSTSQSGGDMSTQHLDRDLGRSESSQTNHTSGELLPRHTDMVNQYGSEQTHAPPSNDSPEGPSNNFHHPPTNRPDIFAYPRPCYRQSYSNEQQSFPQNYQAPENPSPTYSYPSFQTYPGFQDSTYPTDQSHQPSYDHSPDPAYWQQPAHPAVSYPLTVQQDNGSSNGNHVNSLPLSSVNYRYDPNYQPTAEMIAEAHKAARFAVGALAFDEVAVAVDHLRRSLELLTNPSAKDN